MPPKIIYLTGGGSVSHAVSHILADLFQAKVLRIPSDSSVALGAAFRNLALLDASMTPHTSFMKFMQGNQMDVILPNPDHAQVYESMKTKYADLLREYMNT